MSTWRQFRTAEPGRRFREHHERAKDRHFAVKLALAALGAVLIMAGFVMLFIPGPGIVTIAIGLALVATGSSRLSDALDRFEQRVRRWHARKTPSEQA
jgi:uncharacterized membrane protein HdeD (DUF308 family)